MKLFAISDLHLDYKTNREALRDLENFSGDWLITCGDLCTRLDHLYEAMEILTDRFEKVFWVPGNHELWSSKEAEGEEMLGGQEKYKRLVETCRRLGVLTPEDPFVRWPGAESYWIVPLFIPYDYSFRPAEVTQEGAIEWAMESGVLCRDEKLIKTEPFPSMIDWCQHRLQVSEQRLAELPAEDYKILVNHFPLREDLVRLWRIPRFSIWCGTKKTEDYHLRYRAKVVISGHLHMRATDYRDGVRFEEVSLGYPRDWNQGKNIGYYLREILPGPAQPEAQATTAGPFWKFH